ncbi:MAG: hypothetical protein HY084_05005 [Gemmatimonadetes bacterium]|nr:hypothetical protein [Gemmatimonadota bacterium]
MSLRRFGRVMWCALLSPAGLAAQARDAPYDVRVRVVDARSGIGLPEVELRDSTGALLGRADSAGILRLRITGAAPFVGRLQRPGFLPAPLRVTRGAPGDSVVAPMAALAAQTLGTVQVVAEPAVARYSEFERRRATAGGGIFLTDSVIATRGQVRLSDLFRRYPALHVVDSAGTFIVTSARAKKTAAIPGQGTDLAPCVLQVIVDDLRMPWGFDIDQLDRNDIHAIEIYPGVATVPIEYRGAGRDASCGIIAIWTKSR